MKRYIRAGNGNGYDKYYNLKHGTLSFGVHYTVDEDKGWIVKASIIQYHPYDDADYTWAKIDGNQVKFIRSGKVLDKMTIADYDPELYESFDDYLNDTFDQVAMEIVNFDRDVKPIMVHN